MIDWISVAERLPEPVEGTDDSGLLLVLNRGKGSRPYATYHLTSQEWIDDNDYIVHPTHWKPIPAP